MQYTFTIQGSSQEPYWVQFSYTKKSFHATCDCPAGQKKQLCKHILVILDGEIPQGLIDGDTTKIPNIIKAFKESDVFEPYNLYLTLNDEIEVLKKEMNNRKKQFARLLYL